MGVRGLTSFIAQHAETYLTPYELHDNNLVIDGDNLACNLYRDVTGKYSAFGGDYDAFFLGVKEFFLILSQCNVRALVLMDGGYERRKLRTVNQRMRGKIAVIKRINPNDAISVFPILMKEVFVDAVRDSGVPVMRCLFEADEELAALGRRLKCPVLSYDSDFYIHNVEYIPLITLTLKAHLGYQRLVSAPSSDKCLRKSEAINLEKRSKAQHILRDFKADPKLVKFGGKLYSYRFLDCCIYRVENLIAHGSLSREKLPLFAALLGNDYIARSSFKNFFALGLGKPGRSRKMRLQQKRIQVILRWLRSETAESALEKILSRLQKHQRESLKQQFYAATSGYSSEVCHSFEFFKMKYPEYIEKCLNLTKEKFETQGEDDWIDLSNEDDEEEYENEEEESDDHQNELVDHNQSNENEKVDLEDTADEDDDKNEPFDINKYFPEWFLVKLYNANLPRYFVDLLYLRKYINSPQIEHFPYPDCHAVALPILQYIFKLLHSTEQGIKPKLNLNGEEVKPIYFSYMTRAPKISQVRFYKYEIESTLPYKFDPFHSNPIFMQYLFEKTLQIPKLNDLFSGICNLPSDLRLYFLAIVYWLHKSPHYDILHLHSLLICLVVLRTIDSCIPADRDIKMFNKRYGKIIKHERQVREKEFLKTGLARTIRQDLMSLSIEERMQHITKSDCLLVKERLLKHFHMQEVFKKKYDQYSTIVLHGFSEFQSILFQLYGLNSLLEFPYEATKMSSCFSGVFVYNVYDLLRTRVDIDFYIQNHIFQDSHLMMDFYKFLLNFCTNFLPSWKKENSQIQKSKKLVKKERKIAQQKLKSEEPLNTEMLSESSETEQFVDLNNKFCAFSIRS